MGNPLLDSLGHQPRALFDALLTVEADTDTEEGVAALGAGTLLGRVQADLLELRDPAEAGVVWALDSEAPFAPVQRLP